MKKPKPRARKSPAGASAPKPKKAAKEAAVEVAKPGSKKAKALELISRRGGATLAQIVAATESSRGSASNFVNEIGAQIAIKRTRDDDGVLVYSRG